MTRLSTNFNDSEFFKSETYNKIMLDGHIPAWHIERRLIQRLQEIRNYFQKKIKITRGYATNQENIDAGSHSGWSFHKEGKAVDFQVEGVNSTEVFNYIKNTWFDGAVGMIDEWTIHLDIRNNSQLLIIDYGIN